MPAISVAIVGAPYPNEDGSDRQLEILLCSPGEPVALVPEPQNKKDRRAIAVYSVREVQIGYVNAERAGWLGTMMAGREVKAIFQRKASFGAWVRIGFDGEVPALTPAMLAEPDEVIDTPAPDQDFYPDEIWPDD
ncbi:HIRAN domain-containing protein [Novosphingobium colocasiae]|uniref:HIRAN domain-containing protein n=1 Tax=Novosphingobium colocasiae TaxID=1256513 RepID=UPI0035B3A951